MLTPESMATVITGSGNRNQTVWLYQNSGYAFLLLTAFAVVAFWPRYLAQPFDKDIRFHIHAAAMGAWCALLITQPFLIRAGNRGLHRRLGRLAYLVGPAVSLSILVLNHHQSETREITDFRLWLFTSNIGDAVLFFVCWALAMMHRKTPAAHARYMISTAVTFIPPVFDRLFSRYALTSQTRSILPTVGGQPFTILPSFVLVFAVLAVLAWCDIRAAKQPQVFRRMFLVFVMFYAAPLILLMLPWWRTFIVWYLSMPLS